MGRLMFLLSIAVVACGGPDIPAHNGYKSDHAKPWKKAKTLKFDDQNIAKAKGDLTAAVRAYNGVGPDADRYVAAVMQMREWCA